MYNEELVAGSEDQRNWKGIGIAVLVIVAVCMMIVSAVIFLTPDEGLRIKKKPVELFETIDGTLSYDRSVGNWVSDEEILNVDKLKNLNLYNIRTHNTTELVPFSMMRQNEFDEYYLSPDRSYVLFVSKKEPVFRHSFIAKYSIYSVQSQQLFPLVSETEFDKIQSASWGVKGSQVVFIFQNNIYYIPMINETTVEDPIQLTTTGEEGVISNGIADWLYEEEILSASKAYWWSSSGDFLSFMTFNDTNVDEIPFSKYGQYQDPKNIYPEIVTIRYSKPGRPNPIATLNVVNLENTTEIDVLTPPEEFEKIDHYITYPIWIDDSRILLTWTNRYQNYSEISLCLQENQWHCKKHTEQKTNGRGWVYADSQPLVSDDKYYVILPISEGLEGHFHHIVQVSLSTRKKKFLTSGKYDVLELIKVDTNKDILYYRTTRAGKPGESHIMSYSDKYGSQQISPNDNKDCLFYNTDFSHDASYYILSCLGPGVPKFEMWSTKNNCSSEYTLIDNSELKEKINDRAMPVIKTLTVPLSQEYHANVRLYLPSSFKEEDSVKYPMVLNVYAGPSSQMILEKFAINFGTFLASKRNTIYAHIDARGTANRGEKLLHELYKRLGTIEIEDQTLVVKKLIKTFRFIDPKRIGIWGWSYGGYVTGMALAQSDIFKCGVSVAPVTNWVYYDSAYTERYMHMPIPDDNYSGYERANLLLKAEKLEGKQYLLIHGTLDDNVHYQQSMMLSRVLIDKNILFRTQVYPDENHGVPSRHHLYKTIDNFFDTCLNYNLVPSKHSGKS